MQTPFRIFALFAFVALLASCTKTYVLDDMSITQVSEQVADGKWRVEQFVDDNDNYTGFFSGWTFDFQANGTLVIEGNGITYNGSWYIDDDRSSSRGKELYIFIPSGPDPLLDMEEDWYFTEFTSNRMSLYDPEVLGNDILIFTR